MTGDAVHCKHTFQKPFNKSEQTIIFSFFFLYTVDGEAGEKKVCGISGSGGGEFIEGKIFYVLFYFYYYHYYYYNDYK